MQKLHTRRVIVASVIGLILLSVLATFAIQGAVRYSAIEIDDSEITAYAAAMSMRDENKDRSREQMHRKAERYLKLSEFIRTSKVDDPFLGKDFFDTVVRHHYGDYFEGMPVPYRSIPKLKDILADSIRYEQQEAAISEIEDDKKAHLTRAADEQKVLDQLNSDPDPDLYDYCRLYYAAADVYPLE